MALEDLEKVTYYTQHLFRVDYAFFKTREDYHKEANRLTGGKSGRIPSHDGFVMPFENTENGKGLILLCFVDYASCLSVGSFIALLTHECVHIKQFILEHRGEANAGKETEAYLVQEIMLDALDAYEAFFPDLYSQTLLLTKE